MAIPDFQSLMLPLMRFCADNKEHTFNETNDALADQFKLTEEERKALLPSGSQEIFRNRVAWAKLMIDHNVGVSTVATYELKRIDSDYFSEE